MTGAINLLQYIVNPLFNLDAVWVYLIVGFLVFSEAAVFVGFVFPGETAVIVGGVIASQGKVNIAVLVCVVVGAAIAGDSVGFAVGRRFGPAVLSIGLLRRRSRAIEGATGFIRRRGAWAVFIGRFTAFLRAVVPGLSGLSGMHYPTFLAANAAGGIVWGVAFCMLGYLFGSAYKRIENYASWGSYVVLGLVVVVVTLLLIRRHRRERHLLDHDPAPTDGYRAGAEPDGAQTDGAQTDGAQTGGAREEQASGPQGRVESQPATRGEIGA
jgi:membrane protein DedA with SNARE-associated domain